MKPFVLPREASSACFVHPSSPVGKGQSLRLLPESEAARTTAQAVSGDGFGRVWVGLDDGAFHRRVICVLEQFERDARRCVLEITHLLPNGTEDGQLHLHHPRWPTATLRPYQRDLFRSSAWFLQKIAFQRDGSGRVTGFLLSGPVAENIVFERTADR